MENVAAAAGNLAQLLRAGGAELFEANGALQRLADARIKAQIPLDTGAEARHHC